MVSPERAWARIDAVARPLSAEQVTRADAAGRVLARALAATVDVPAHDVSAMDGYAAASPVRAGERRPVDGVVAAGDPPGRQILPDTAVRIMTGAPVPRGADTVVPIELTDGGREQVLFSTDARVGAHIRRRGEVLEAGQPLLAPGAVVTPSALALVATHGYRRIEVVRRPRLAILATGDEVVPADREPDPGQLRDSHTDFLLAAGRALGLEPTALGIAPDELEALRRLVREGLAADVLLVCGGVSMGEFDFVETVLADAGCEMLFDAVALQPGKPLVAAIHPGGWVFGLPGNPASVMVCYWLFVRPLLRRLAGFADGYWKGALAGTLSAPLPGAKGRDRFLPAEVEIEGGHVQVRPLAPKGSHDVVAYGAGTGLVRVPARAAPAAAGDPCEVLPVFP